MAAPDLRDALTEMVQHLNLSGVPYMLVGSAAGAWYGLDRTTADFDFVLDLTPAGVPRLVNAFTPGFYCDEEQIADAVRRRFMCNVVSHQTGLKADFIILKDRPFDRGGFARKASREWHGAPIWVTSGEDLVLNKLIWAKESQSERQLADVRAILASGRVELSDYFNRWVVAFDLHEQLDASRETRHGA